MTKITVDLSAIRNEITQIKDEAFIALNAKSDTDRRNTLSIIIERLKTLQARMSSDATSVEVK